ncbi:MAG: DUF1501 domain-containing protein [Planctomycetota bacterium]|nr:DUF1501 domain-containing protein [Planctomycetota bacterium]
MDMWRRDFLYGMGASIGSIAFSSMVGNENRLAGREFPRANRAKSDSRVHFPGAKAKHCIFLYMEGGPSHIDTFDPKPKLRDLHLKEFRRSGAEQSAMSSGKRYYVQSPFEFNQQGKSGADMCDRWKHLAGVADEICFYRGCQVESVNHPTANYHVNTGNRFGGDPCLGAWVNYGLGTENENLPGFIVLPELSFPQGGSANWSNGFLPTSLQGTALRAQGSPILDIAPRREVTRDHQQAKLEFLHSLNRRHLQIHPDQEQLEARMKSYELAFRMQTQVPDLVNIDDESEATLAAYGIGNKTTGSFGRRCLMARKLVEKGVRFVQLYASTWDSHDYLAKAHGALIPKVDQPIAALIRDLRQRGLLEETLIVWMGEFGRTPDNGVRGSGIAYGRDHNPNAMTVWLAGGGCKAGHTIGATDETGAQAVETVHQLRDLHVTLLRLLGLDDNRLTFYHAGRFKQLSQFGGKVISELIA